MCPPSDHQVTEAIGNICFAWALTFFILEIRLAKIPSKEIYELVNKSKKPLPLGKGSGEAEDKGLWAKLVFCTDNYSFLFCCRVVFMCCFWVVLESFISPSKIFFCHSIIDHRTCNTTCCHRIGDGTQGTAIVPTSENMIHRCFLKHVHFEKSKFCQLAS